MSLLTIGIPTFNRKEIVKKNILNILSDNFLFDNDINLVVSDNGSTDDTFDTLCDIQKQYKFGKKLKIIRNKKNLGFTKNIFELFGSSDTKYLLLTSDEDFIVKKNFYLLKNFLEEKKDKNENSLFCPFLTLCPTAGKATHTTGAGVHDRQQ